MDVTSLPLVSAIGLNDGMTDTNEHNASDDAMQTARHANSDPQPANEALPDGQFQDQQMPTTDGEPAEPDPRPGDAAESGDGDPLPDTTDDQGRPLENPSGG